MSIGYVSVIVTVGPNRAYRAYLQECLDSIKDQWCSEEVFPKVVLVDDAAHLEDMSLNIFGKMVKNPWNFGQAASINIGVLNAVDDWVFIMGGCDDKLLPDCIKTCWNTSVEYKDREQHVFYPLIKTSEGEVSALPQGVWMMHRSLWAKFGGYPVEAGIGEVDAIFCSMMLKQGVRFVPCGNKPLYWHREHPAALTANKSMRRRNAAQIIRELCTHEWKEPDWIHGYGY